MRLVFRLASTVTSWPLTVPVLGIAREILLSGEIEYRPNLLATTTRTGGMPQYLVPHARGGWDEGGCVDVDVAAVGAKHQWQANARDAIDPWNSSAADIDSEDSMVDTVEAKPRRWTRSMPRLA